MYRGFVMDTVSDFSEPDHKYATICAKMVRVSMALQPLHQNNAPPKTDSSLKKRTVPAARGSESF